MASTPSSPKHINSSSPSSPEFEFWGVVGSNNPSIDLPSADELFSDGILLPLQNLNVSSASENKPSPDASNSSFIDPSSFPSSSPSPGPASKRWKDIFIKAGERERRKEKTRLSLGNNNAELNINIWPFSRSRSAGNASGIGSWSSKGKTPVKLSVVRTVSSAPCSRSNSRNEDSSPADGAQVSSTTASSIIKRWAQTGRLGPSAGIRVGRAGPVWQLRRKKQQLQQQECGETKKEKAGVDNGGGVKVLNLNVNTCIGYRNQASCSDGAGAGGNVGIFSLKAIFSKKVY